MHRADQARHERHADSRGTVRPADGHGLQVMRSPTGDHPHIKHDSPQMTAHYARLHDTTVRRHWKAARKVDITGQAVVVDPAGPLAEAAWAKQRLGRATQALPNGFCGLPVQKTCPHANACLTCPMFVTTAEFLPQHRTHRAQVIELITTAQARGQARLVEMNQQILGNLDRIITTLDDDAATDQAVSNAG
jgi:hypothetical protein